VDDPAFGAGARVAATGALGLASGEGRGRMRFQQVDPGPLPDGTAVVTTGSDTFVADVPIGRGTAAARAPDGLTSTATLEPFVSVGTLLVVGVVVEPARTQPRPPLLPK
jgi:rod shape-determining protein MreC